MGRYEKVAYLVLCLKLCVGGHAICSEPAGRTTEQAVWSNFTDPQAVLIKGLPQGSGGTPISTEEPFVSRDGRFLFFNSGHAEGNKDLHYAESVKGVWIYRGELGPRINNPREVQANPSMDQNRNFYYVDSGIERMIRKAEFIPARGRLQFVREFSGIPRRNIRFFARKLIGNMGVEVSADGNTVYFSRATWTLKGLGVGPVQASNILFVRKRNGKYVYDEKEANRIMKMVNTADLEYAASISCDGLELFFTRLRHSDLKAGHVCSRIMRVTRKSRSLPFGRPKTIAAIGSKDFVEGPSIADNGRTLYYHKRVGAKFRLFRVVRKRKAGMAGRRSAGRSAHGKGE